MGSSERGGKGSDSTAAWRNGSLEVVSFLFGWLALKCSGKAGGMLGSRTRLLALRLFD